MNNDLIKSITLPKIVDLRGNLSFLEDFSQIPFKIERVYWIYDIPGGESREGLAFKNTTELIIPLSGGFTIEVIKGEEHSLYTINQTNKGLLIPPMTWRKITNFLSGSVCLVITSTKYSEMNYITNYQEYFKEYQNIVWTT